LFEQDVCLDFSFRADNAGRSMPARIAMIAITTSSSINVNRGRTRRGAEAVEWRGLFSHLADSLDFCE